MRIWVNSSRTRTNLSESLKDEGQFLQTPNLSGSIWVKPSRMRTNLSIWRIDGHLINYPWFVKTGPLDSKLGTDTKFNMELGVRKKKMVIPLEIDAYLISYSWFVKTAPMDLKFDAKAKFNMEKPKIKKKSEIDGHLINYSWSVKTGPLASWLINEMTVNFRFFLYFRVLHIDKLVLILEGFTQINPQRLGVWRNWPSSLRDSLKLALILEGFIQIGPHPCQDSSVVGSFVFVFLTPSLIYVPIFVDNRAFFNFGGVGLVGVVVGRRDRHFRFPHTEFSLGTNFRWKPSIFLEPLPCQMGPILTPDYTTHGNPVT